MLVTTTGRWVANTGNFNEIIVTDIEKLRCMKMLRNTTEKH
jgi:hypothetical protein